MFKIQTILNFSMKNQIFPSFENAKKKFRMNMFKVYFIVQISNQISNYHTFFQRNERNSEWKEIRSKIISSFENQPFVASNQILNYVQTSSNHFSILSKKLNFFFSPKTEIQNVLFKIYISRSLYYQDRLSQLKISVWTNFTIIQHRPTSRISSGVRDRVNACVLIGNSLIESAWLIADPRLINTRNVN